MKESENKEHSNMECSNDYHLRLSEKEISEVWDSMPGQPNGFYKSFGYSQFAHAIEDKLASRCRAQGGNTNTEIIGSAVSTAVGEPVLSNERIAQLNREAQDQSISGELPSVYLARAVEREVVARLAAPTQAKPVASAFYWSVTGSSGWDFKWLGSKPEHATRVDLFAAPTQVSAPNEEILSLHRRLAAEVLHAQQGWERAEAKSRECIELRERMAQVSAPQADESSTARVAALARQFFVAYPTCFTGYYVDSQPVGKQLTEAAFGLAASAAQKVRAVPESWKLVPMEATWEMTRPAFSFDLYKVKCECGRQQSGGLSHNKAAALFKEMCDAAPNAPNSASTAPAAMDEGRSPWISIDDQLPELHVTVALLDENRWMNTGSSDHNVNWHGAGYLCEFGHKYWSVFGEMRSQCLDAVTHWMPLPAAPASQPSLDEVTGAGKGEGNA